jgi:hypothetical protein
MCDDKNIENCLGSLVEMLTQYGRSKKFGRYQQKQKNHDTVLAFKSTQ